jgi:Flp pilus assembly protein TadD
MGLAYDRNNRKDEALRALLKAVELEPQYFKNHQQLGAYYDAQANYAESLKHFRRAAELEPGDPGVHYAVGSALFNLNLPDQAEAEFRTSLSLGESAKGNHALGLLLMYQGQDSEAIPYFRRAIAMQEEGEPYVFLGVACRRIGHLREAAEANRAGLRLLERQTAYNPRNTHIRSMLAYFAAAVGERNRAESEAAQVATPLLQNEKTKYYLVLTYETLRQRDRTLALLSGLKPGMIDSVARWPDLADLHQDPRFMELTAKALKKENK